MPVSIANSAFGDQAFSGANTLTISGYVHGGGALAVFTVGRTNAATGVTANGTAMVARGSESGDNDLMTQGWTLDNIAAFTGDIVVSWPGEMYLGVAHVLSFSGTASSPFGSAVTAFGSSTTPGVTVSSSSGRLVVAALVSLDTGVTHTIGSGQTLVRNDAGTGSDASLRHRLVTTTEGGASSVTMDGTLSSSRDWAAVGFDVAPAVMPVSVANSAFGDQAFSGAGTLTISGYAHGGGALAVFTVGRSSGATGVTANGTAMVARGSESGDNDLITQGWTLDNIAAFTGDIVVSWVGGEQYLGVAHVLSFSGTASSPFGSAVTAVGSSTTPGVTVSSSSGRLVVAALVSLNTDVTHTIGSGQTLVRNDAGTGSEVSIRHRLVTTTEGGASSVTMDGTLSSSRDWAAVGFDVAPGAGGGDVTTYRDANLPAGMTATPTLSAGGIATLSTAFGGSVYDTSDLVIGGSRYNAATTLTVSTTGTTGRTDLLNHLTTVAANDADYKIIVPVGTLSGGQYTLPAKSFPSRHCWIVNTDINSGSFGTAIGTKVPASTTGMTILEGPNAAADSIVVFAESGSARGYSFHGCVIQNNQSSASNDLQLGIIECRRSTSQSSIDSYPGRLYIDRCWLRGSTTTDTRRGILMNGPYLHIQDSRITEVHCVGNESAGIGGWTGAKYHKHINCTIEAGTQAILYGGADPHQPNTNTLDPTDHYSERVYALKPLIWLTTHPSYAGTHWTVKTGFEAKNVRRWLIDRCWTQNCWPDAQTGYAMLFQNLADDNTNHLENRIDDVIVRNHRFDYVAHGLNLLSRVAYNGGTLPTHRMTRVVFDNVLMTRVGGLRTDASSIILNGLSQAIGNPMQLLGDIDGVTIDRVTADEHTDRAFRLADNGASGSITNLVVRLGQYGVFRDGGNVGDTALANFFSAGLTVNGNVGYDLSEATMTSGWDSDETNSSMAFQDYANYDYRLTTQHLTKGVDGGVPGCDIATLNTLLSGIDS